VFAGDHRTPSQSNSIALSARSSGFLRNGETVIADRVVEATILFCDLVGFTTLSQTLPADRVIDFLSKIFSAFARFPTLNSLPSRIQVVLRPRDRLTSAKPFCETNPIRVTAGPVRAPLSCPAFSRLNKNQSARPF
jgi:hypothetical protein